VCLCAGTCLVLGKGRKALDIVVLQKGAIQAEVPSSAAERVEPGDKVADAAAGRLECPKDPVVTVSRGQISEGSWAKQSHLPGVVGHAVQVLLVRRHIQGVAVEDLAEEIDARCG